MTDHDAWPIEGYAALFGIADLEGDVVRAGAFRQSLAALATIPGSLPSALRSVWMKSIVAAGSHPAARMIVIAVTHN